MKGKGLRSFGAAILCMALILADSSMAYAEVDYNSGPALNTGIYIATVNVEKVNINKYIDSNEVLMEASYGDVFQILEDMGNGWVKVDVRETEGYLPAADTAIISETESIEEAVSETTERIEELAAQEKRQQLVNYALQFVGGRYVYGGNDPHTGADCSGFTRYIMLHSAGISLARSSSSQAYQGTVISADQMQPGDLLFYGGAGSINHVAMYIGNGQIVHASTERSGIKISKWNYRNPVRIVSYL